MKKLGNIKKVIALAASAVFALSAVTAFAANGDANCEHQLVGWYESYVDNGKWEYQLVTEAYTEEITESHWHCRSCDYCLGVAETEEAENSYYYHAYKLDGTDCGSGAYTIVKHTVDTIDHDAVYDYVWVSNYEWVVVSAADAQEGDVFTRAICSICSYFTADESVYLAWVAAQHEWSLQSSSEATCTEDGSATYECVASHNCGETKTETTDAALGHNYEETSRTEATCTAEGSITYTCTRCSDTYSDVIEKVAHTYTSSEITKNPECETAGILSYNCDVCKQDIEEEIEALGHDYQLNSAQSTTPDCTNAGTLVYECSRCEDSFEESTEALGKLKKIRG